MVPFLFFIVPIKGSDNDQREYAQWFGLMQTGRERFLNGTQ